MNTLMITSELKKLLMCRRLTISDRKKEKFKPENSFEVTYNTMYSCIVLNIITQRCISDREIKPNSICCDHTHLIFDIGK